MEKLARTVINRRITKYGRASARGNHISRTRALAVKIRKALSCQCCCLCREREKERELRRAEGRYNFSKFFPLSLTPFPLSPALYIYTHVPLQHVSASPSRFVSLSRARFIGVATAHAAVKSAKLQSPRCTREREAETRPFQSRPR